MGSLLLFDGTCNFCNGLVQFVVDHERDQELRFAALQSDEGRAALTGAVGEERAEAILGDSDGPSTMVVLEDGVVHARSTAALRVARHLRAPWRWARILVVVPRPLRDVVYRWFARNRYRWFGRSETCRVPTPELRGRFLAAHAADEGRSYG